MYEEKKQNIYINSLSLCISYIILWKDVIFSEKLCTYQSSIFSTSVANISPSD